MSMASIARTRKRPEGEALLTRSATRKRLEKRLRVMDGAAFALARENRMPIIVFSVGERGAIETVLRGKGRATIVG